MTVVMGDKPMASATIDVDGTADARDPVAPANPVARPRRPSLPDAAPPTRSPDSPLVDTTSVFRYATPTAIVGVFLLVLAQLVYHRSEFRELFWLPWLSPVLICFGFYLHSRALLLPEFWGINEVLVNVDKLHDRDLTSKLDFLEHGTSICRRAEHKMRSVVPVASVLLLYGLFFSFLPGSYVAGYIDESLSTRDLQVVIARLVFLDGPAVSLAVGLVAAFWCVYEFAKLRGIAGYFRDETDALIGRKRILDRFPHKYAELANLTQQIRDFVRENQRASSTQARLNGVLLMLGIVLSAAVTVAGILGEAGLLGTDVNANAISAILGVSVGVIIGVQSTFRIADKASFRESIASQGQKLVDDLVVQCE
jgi:hypothetical protein